MSDDQRPAGTAAKTVAHKRGRPFQKGKGADRDQRINAKGRKTTDFVSLRKLAQSIADEPMIVPGSVTKECPAGTVAVDPVTGLVITKGEWVLRSWALSGDPRLQIQFMETCYGKVPQRTENVNIDLGTLSDEQLAKLVEGKDLDDVVGN